MTRNLAPIGRFAQLCQLSIKALRHYDEIDLLKPAVVDPDSGYRYYALSQLYQAETIRLLRSIEMPLDDIRQMLTTTKPAALRTILAAHQQRLVSRLTDLQQRVDYLQRLIAEPDLQQRYPVQVKTVEPMIVARQSARAQYTELPRAIGNAVRSLSQMVARQRLRVIGPMMVLYHEMVHPGGDASLIEVCLPVEATGRRELAEAGRELPGGPVAYTLHCGPYREIRPAYFAVSAWLQSHGHDIAQSPREIYLIGPDDESNPLNFRTEIAWPIR